MVTGIPQHVRFLDCFEDFFAIATIEELEFEENSGIMDVIIFAGGVRALE